MLIILTFCEQSPRKGQRKSAIKVGQQTPPKVVILCPGDHSEPRSHTPSFKKSPVTFQSVFMTPASEPAYNAVYISPFPDLFRDRYHIGISFAQS